MQQVYFGQKYSYIYFNENEVLFQRTDLKTRKIHLFILRIHLKKKIIIERIDPPNKTTIILSRIFSLKQHTQTNCWNDDNITLYPFKTLFTSVFVNKIRQSFSQMSFKDERHLRGKERCQTRNLGVKSLPSGSFNLLTVTG